MSLVSLFNSESSASRLRSRIGVPDKVTNYFRLKYYQYEVTFGLYVMTPMEKLVLNTIVGTIIALLLYGILFGLQPFLVRTVCRMIWYISGSYEGVEDICCWASITRVAGASRHTTDKTNRKVTNHWRWHEVLVEDTIISHNDELPLPREWEQRFYSETWERGRSSYR